MIRIALLFDEAFLRRLEQLSLIYRSAARSRMQGERRSLGRGGSIEFADFRPYTLGDDFRRVDWNAYARLDRLFIKLYHEEQQIGLHLLVDNSPSMDWGSPDKLDLARRLAAALGYIGLLGLDRVTLWQLHASDKPLPTPRRFSGKRSALGLFSACRDISARSTSENGLTNLTALLSQISQPGFFMIFSDLFDSSWQPALNRLLDRGHELLLVNILSPDEINPQLEGEFRLIDRENSAQVEITADFETLQAYRSHLQDWQEEWKRFCSKRNSTYISISTETPLEELLFNMLEPVGILK